MGKVVASIPDGTQWATVQVQPFCTTVEHLQWNVGKSGIDVSRLAQPIREEFKREGVKVAADPDEPFGNLVTSDIVVGATIVEIDARLCGADTIKGEVTMRVAWEIYSNARRQVMGVVRTRATGSTKEKPITPLRLIGLVMAENTKVLQANEAFHRLLMTSATAAAPGHAPALATAPQDVLPHPQPPVLLKGSAAARGVKLAESIPDVVMIVAGTAQGSGFLASNDGYVITAAHVVGANAFVKIHWSDGFETVGQVVRADARRDVALVKTDSRGRAPLALRAQSPQPGDVVYAIGSPMQQGLQGSVTRGIVSADRTMNGFSYIQSDVTVNPGNSGGPLLNETGEVLGIADLSMRGIGGAVGSGLGINFFIPIADVLLFLSAEPR